MLEVEAVSFAYPGGLPVLTDIAFSVGRGEVVAIVGRNGAGKSTLLRLLNGLYHPAAGRIVVEGHRTSETPVFKLARSVGTVFQAPEQQIFNPTISDEIAFGPRQLGLEGEALDQRVTGVLDRIGLREAAATHPLDVDQAGRRLVAIGSVLAMQPPILLLDEPQRGLDRAAMQRLEAIIAQQKAENGAVILVCHDMDFVARTSDRVLALARGALAANKPTAAFFSDPALTGLAGVEVPDVLQLSMDLRLASSLTPQAFAQAWIGHSDAV